MMKKLENLRWVPSWVSHLGCLKGCLDFLGLDISMSWLFGGTGHAFVLNIGQDACPSGPTAWKTTRLSELGQNLGYQAHCLFGTKYDHNLEDLQQRAWDFIREAIDQGIPCYGWELAIPEFYVIFGYDEVGYYYSGTEADDGAGPKPWQDLGDTGIGIVEVYKVEPGNAAGIRTIVREALSFAVEHAQGPTDYKFPDYEAGPAGYDLWIKGVEAGTAIRMGMAYNAAVWATCRKHASAFLQEAKMRLADGDARPFDQAIALYSDVAGRLDEVSQLYPFSENVSQNPVAVDRRSEKAVHLLQQAKDAETRGLDLLSSLVRSML